MFLGILTLITALAISAVAIYYSVAGLVAIFAAAALPIMIMGGVLEVSKLVTAVWLHRYWKQATWWLKSYLSLAVVVLMLITSMGIFGFLSKAHIEQTAQSTDNLAQVETLQSEIDRNLAIIGRAENKIRELDNSQSNTDTTIQDQIDREQERIDTAYDRVQPLVEEQTRNLEDQIALFGLDKVDAKIAALEQAMNINTRDRDAVRVLQSMVGARPDGAYGSGTAARVDEYRNGLNAERDAVLAKIQEARRLTNEEIARIRQGAENQIAESNKLINRLREQLGTQDNADEVQAAIDEQNKRIRTASNEVDQLTEQKIALESEYRKLEAEVGPIKYIAEFVYGESADNNMLEEAVRWVIITIIFVFDPLAVLLLIASQYTFEWRNTRKDDDGERLRREYEQARAQRIVDNPGVTFDDPVPSGNNDSDDDKDTEDKEEVDEPRQENTEEEQQDAEELRTGQDSQSIQAETGDDPDVAEDSQEERSVDDSGGNVEEIVQRSEHRASDSGRDTANRVAVAGGVENVTTEEQRPTETSDGDGLTPGTYTGDPQPVPVEQEDDLTQDEKQEIASTYVQPKKKVEHTELSEESKREANLEAKEESIEYQVGKTRWKQDHPDQTLKRYKNLYIQGVIDTLPWERPQYTTVEEPQGYQQNAEQNESSIFNRIRHAEQDQDNNQS